MKNVVIIRLRASFGPGQSLHVPGLSDEASYPWDCGEHEPQRGTVTTKRLLESFYEALKTECVERQSYRTRPQARQSIFENLEAFYNRQRLHSSLGYVSPGIYERELR